MNVTTSDALGILKACFALAPFMLAPGYALAWALNLFEFRERRFLLRLALAVPLSIAICPMLSYLLSRFLPSGLWVFYAVTTFSCVFLLAKEIQRRRSPSFSKHVWIASILMTLWTVGAIATLVDLQVGDKLFLPISAYDHSTILAQDTDPAWHDPSSWIWIGNPIVANNYVRAFRCNLSGNAFSRQP